MPQPDKLAEAAGTNWDDARLWGAFLLSVFSLYWSDRTRRVANKASKALRKQTIRLEEFRSSVKAPLLEALALCEECSARGESVALSAKPMAELKDDIAELNRLTISALGKLERRLVDANASEFADGTDWLDDYSEFSDRVFNAFNAAANEVNSDKARRSALISAKENLGDLRARVKSRVDAQINLITTND